jgi:ATP-binding cassette, subfamily B (MDR/TAP), member 1
MDPTLSETKKGIETSVSFSKLISLNTCSEKILLYLGWFFAFTCGVGMPATFIVFGDSMEALGNIDEEGLTPEDLAQKNFDLMLVLCIWMFGIGVVVWLFAFLYATSLAVFSEKTARKIKIAYLQAIFRQDASWFDNTNYTELSANLSKQTSVIQRGVGDKTGLLMMSMGNFIGGIGLGFWKGPLYCLALLGCAPPMIAVIVVSTNLMTQGASASLKAYGQSSGYAT